MLAFRLTERKDNVNCYAQCLTAMEVPLSPLLSLSLCVCAIISTGEEWGLHHYCGRQPNGKSNIFAYEMSERSKHGGSQARAASKKQAKRFPVR